MIVVDQRTDSEKLLELLHQVEQEELDYKSEISVEKGKCRLDFVKDAVAMSNRPSGGYILMGVTDDGRPCQSRGTCDRRAEFDAANLANVIRAYVDGEVKVVTQWHELDEHEVLLIYIHGHRDGLPLPMTKIGQYKDDQDRDKVVFHEGQIYVREGAGNVQLRHAHWSTLLSVHDEQVRLAATATVEGVLRQLTLPAASTPGVPPLVMDMKLETFGEAVARNLEAGMDISIRQFVRLAQSSIASGAGVAEALDRLTLLILQCIYFDRDEVARMALEHLERSYQRLTASRADTRVRLEIITRLYVLGSLVVRLERWGWIRDLVLRPVSSPDYPEYIYSSWVRQGQVAATRAGVFPEDAGTGMMISLARALMQREPSLRPDIPSNSLPEPEHLDARDVLLNSLCQFDLLYCVLVAADGKDKSAGYPACSAFRQERVEPAVNLLVRNSEVQAELLPNSAKSEIATALREVFEVARRESLATGGGWWGLPNAAEDFVRREAAPPSPV